MRQTNGLFLHFPVPRLPQGPPDAVPVRRRLTPRERQITVLVAACEQNKEIAMRLGLAEGTVKVYLSRVYRKLELERIGSPRTALARVVWEADRAAELPKAA